MSGRILTKRTCLAFSPSHGINNPRSTSVCAAWQNANSEALVDDAKVFGNRPPLALARSFRKHDREIGQRCPKIIEVAQVCDVCKTGSADIVELAFNMSLLRRFETGED